MSYKTKNIRKHQKNIAYTVSISLFIALCIIIAIAFSSNAKASGTVITGSTIPEGIYQIRNAYTGKYMEVEGGSTSNGAKMIQATESIANYQKFYVQPLGNNNYYILPYHAMDKSIDIPNWSQGVVQAEIYTHLGTDNPVNQTFRIEAVNSNGNYAIKTFHTIGSSSNGFSNSCLTVDQTTNAVMQNVYSSSNSLNFWKFEKVKILEDGVYSLENKAFSGYYLNVPYCDYGDNVTLDAYNFEENPKSNNRAGLFKFVRQYHTVYKIYPMADNSNVLQNDNFLIKSCFGSDFSWNVSIDNEDNVYISPAEGNFTNYYIGIANSTYQLRMQSLSSAGNKAKWIATKNNENMLGVEVEMNGSHIIPMGTTNFDISDLGTPVAFYSSNPNVNSAGTVSYSVASVSGTNTTIATITSAGRLNCFANKVGVVNVMAYYSSGAVKTTNIYVKPPQNREFFFLQNLDTFGCIKQSGIGAIKAEYDYDASQIWEWVHYSGEWYKIKNVATGQYLTSPSNTTAGASISLTYSSSTNSNNLWKKEVAPSNTRGVVIRSKYMYENAPSFCLTLSNNILVQNAYSSNLPDNDEFFFVKLGEDAVYNRTLTWDTSINPAYFTYALSDYYDSFCLISEDIYIDLSTAKSLLESSSVCVFDGHGSSTSSVIYDSPQRFINNIDIYNPNDINNSLDLSGMDMIFFAGCSTGGNPCDFCNNLGVLEGHNINCSNSNSNVLNMPQSAEMVGAKVSIGWAKNVGGDASNDWIDTFLIYMNMENSDTEKLYTAIEAFNETNRSITWGNANTAVLYGTNPDFRLNR